MNQTKKFLAIAAISFGIVNAVQLNAQDRQRYLYDSMSPPGQVGQQQLLRRSAMQNHMQPVQLIGPPGSNISIYSGGGFQSLGSDKATVGMLIGQTYRIKISQIPDFPGFEVYPSVEVINRLYPPAGLELKFPVEVHIAQADLSAALNGAIVTRVVYLEDPEDAVPAQQFRDDQPYFDVAPDQDPLRVAQQIGRPMAIMRAGSRIPDSDDMHGFTFGSPPVQIYESPASPAEVQPNEPQTPVVGQNAQMTLGDRIR